jgi:transposase
MEAPMQRGHFIGIDVHCQTCDVAVITASGTVVQRQRCATTIPALMEVLQSVPRPRALVIEEGAMAGWLWRNLHAAVERMAVAEPRRNRLIAKDGDKDDPIDAEKLAQLYRGGYIKEVHQVASLEQAVFKQLIALYHHRVRQRVREAHRITSLFRQHGVMIREKAYSATEDRASLLARLPANPRLAALVRQLWSDYDASAAQEDAWRHRLVQAGQELEVVGRFTALPGIGWVRAATLYAYLDSPWRFRSKEALCKYLGIGLQRKHSGQGLEHVGVPQRTHRLLKGAILGAALSAVVQGSNPFADLYRRWRERGLASKLARRNVARRLAATLWGLWKNGNAYNPAWVVKAGSVPTAAAVSG